MTIHSSLLDQPEDEKGLTPDQLAALRQQKREQATQNTADQIDADYEKSRRAGKSAYRLA